MITSENYASPPVDLFTRFCRHCEWRFNNGSDDVRTAAGYDYVESLQDSPDRAKIPPKIICRNDF